MNDESLSLAAPPARRRVTPLLRRSLLRRARAAYTAVEVLMSMAVLAVGVVGIISMQKVTLASNLHAKNLAIATHIAQSWVGVLEAEAALWGTTGSLARTTWLNQGMGIITWFRPSYSDALAFGPAFDALGNPVETANQDPEARFCVDLRFSPLTTNNVGGGLVRVEVRVIWLRLDTVLTGTLTAPSHACSVNDVTVQSAAQLFHFVMMSGAVRQVGI